MKAWQIAAVALIVGTVVGITASANDADATTNAITYSLQDDDGGRFTINSSTGVVTVAAGIDREADGVLVHPLEYRRGVGGVDDHEHGVLAAVQGPVGQPLQVKDLRGLLARRIGVGQPVQGGKGPVWLVSRR